MNKRPKAVDNFLTDLCELYGKYNLAISHEDGNGAFIVKPWSKDLEEWMMDATFELMETT